MQRAETADVGRTEQCPFPNGSCPKTDGAVTDTGMFARPVTTSLQDLCRTANGRRQPCRVRAGVGSACLLRVVRFRARSIADEAAVPVGGPNWINHEKHRRLRDLGLEGVCLFCGGGAYGQRGTVAAEPL